MQVPIVNIILWSSTLPPLRVPCVHENWSSVPLVAFLARKINKEQKPHQKNLFKGTYIKVGTLKTDMFEWQALKYDCQFAFHYLQTAHFYQLWKRLYPCFQRKAFPMNRLKKNTWATSNSFFHCFITSDSDHIFFCYIWKHKIVITTTK